MYQSYSVYRATTNAQCTSSVNLSGPPFAVATSHTKVQHARLDLLVVCNLKHMAFYGHKILKELCMFDIHGPLD